jgi:rhomboid protease GluP
VISSPFLIDADKRVPVITVAVALLTAAVSIVALAHPHLLHSLERHPTSGASRASWRLVTSLFVHDGWFALAFNLIGFTIVGSAVERRMGAARWIVVYLVGGIVGERVGIRWQPVGAGNSVATFGLVGALVAVTLRVARTPTTFAVLFASEWVLVYTGLALHGVAGALVAGAVCAPLSAVVGRLRETSPRALNVALAAGTLALAAALCIMHDIHGPPLIVGAFIGAILHRDFGPR